MNIKKFLIGASAGAVMLATMATPAFATYCDASAKGCEQAAEAGAQCNTGASSGAFGAFGQQGNYDSVHDVDRTTPGVQGYDEFADGTDDNVGQGAEGGVTGGTGDRNSSVCGDPQHDF